VRQLVVKKAKTKQWFTIVAPKFFGDREIGRTIVSNPNSLIGRRITVSAIEMSGNVEKYYLKLAFKISKVNGDKAFTEFDGTEILRDYISRMVLHRVRKVEAVQDLQTKDNVKIRVKSLAVISRRVKSTIQLAVRNKLKEMVTEYVTNSTLEEFIEKILSDEMRNRVLQELRKIYPVRNFDIRKTEIP